MVGSLGLERVDHFGIAVRSIRDTLPLFMDLLGAEFVNGGDDPVLGIRTLQLRVAPGVRFELLQPARDDCYLHDYLDRRGPGFHHVTMKVRDIEHALVALDEAGYEVVDTDLDSDPTWRQTYIRPRSGHGMLVQVVESPHDWDAPTDTTLEGVLAGEYLWDGDRAVPRAELEG